MKTTGEEEEVRRRLVRRDEGRSGVSCQRGIFIFSILNSTGATWWSVLALALLLHRKQVPGLSPGMCGVSPGTLVSSHLQKQKKMNEWMLEDEASK